MKLGRFMAEWRARLLHWQARAADPDSGQVWLASIRVRILQFLISRYADQPVPKVSPAVKASARRSWPAISFCLVAEPDGPPPRSAEEMAQRLESIRRCNRRRRRGWFWWS